MKSVEQYLQKVAEMGNFRIVAWKFFNWWCCNNWIKHPGAYYIFGPWEWALFLRWALLNIHHFQQAVSLFCNNKENNNKTSRCTKAEFNHLPIVTLSLWESLALPLWSISQLSGPPLVHFSVLDGGGGGLSFEAGCLLTFPTYRVGAYLN